MGERNDDSVPGQQKKWFQTNKVLRVDSSDLAKQGYASWSNRDMRVGAVRRRKRRRQMSKGKRFG